MCHLTFEQLLSDLYDAFLDASRGKHGRSCVIEFEKNLAVDLFSLATELWKRTYQAKPSRCFIITDPKQREVFAADFRDRIVHHLYYRYSHQIFERTFIADSYSCIEKRGTHYGIKRLRHHIQSESRCYTRPCYVLKIDIKGYFMHIDRHRLCSIATRRLKSMAYHLISSDAELRWKDVVDYDFILWLTDKIALLDPIEGCTIVGAESDWVGLPPDKSLFCSPADCGLPIGNLTSQLFSNVYLGEFDQYMKRHLGCRHYGRYVDDAYVVSCDLEWLSGVVPQAAEWLRTNLSLDLHPLKTRIIKAEDGVEFLGAFIKPDRIYVADDSLKRMKEGISSVYASLSTGRITTESARDSVNSWLGVLGHYDTYLLRRHLFTQFRDFRPYFEFDESFRVISSINSPVSSHNRPEVLDAAGKTLPSYRKTKNAISLIKSLPSFAVRNNRKHSLWNLLN